VRGGRAPGPRGPAGRAEGRGGVLGVRGVELHHRSDGGGGRRSDGGLTARRPSLSYSTSWMMISTRRFFWRPASVSLEATGWVLPRPTVVIVSGSISLVAKYSFTALARASDSFRFA